jgi:DNA-binding response OmpR family regulator
MENRTNILIVEDNLEMLSCVKSSLEDAGFIVDTAEDGKIGSDKAENNKYDMILLDNGLPFKSGREICSEIRQKGNTVPIIILSVRSEIDTKVKLFQTGADDYMTKPYVFAELLARVQSLLRRTSKPVILQIGDLVLNANALTVKYGEKDISLTAKEFGLLQHLMSNKGKVCCKSEILEQVWGEKSDTNTKTVESHIWKLRKKLKQRGKKDIIRTKFNGYKIEE